MAHSNTKLPIGFRKNWGLFIVQLFAFAVGFILGIRMIVDSVHFVVSHLFMGSRCNNEQMYLQIYYLITVIVCTFIYWLCEKAQHR